MDISAKDKRYAGNNFMPLCALLVFLVAMLGRTAFAQVYDSQSFGPPGGVIQSIANELYASVARITSIEESTPTVVRSVDGGSTWLTVTNADGDVAVGAGNDPLRLDNPIAERISKGSRRVRLKTVASGLTAPNWGVAAPGDDRSLYVSDQNGMLWRIDLPTGSKTPFLDLSARLVSLGVSGEGSGDERGFLGVAFHPDYANNGLLYTDTSEPTGGDSVFPLTGTASANHKTVIAEWRLTDSAVSPTDPRVIFDIEHRTAAC